MLDVKRYNELKAMPVADRIALAERIRPGLVDSPSLKSSIVVIMATEFRLATEKAERIAAYRHGWQVAAAGGLLCDCVCERWPVVTPDIEAGWRASRAEDAALRRVGVRG